MAEIKSINNIPLCDETARNQIENMADRFATEEYVDTAIANAQINGGSGGSGGSVNVDLSNFATKEDLNDKADVNHTHDEYLTAIPDEYLTAIPDEYITESDLNEKGYLTDESLVGYATKIWVASQITYHTHDEYITEDELNDKGYLTEHQSLEGYATNLDVESVRTYVDSSIGDINSILDFINGEDPGETPTPGGGMPGTGGGDEPEGPTITPDPSEPEEPTETYAISFSTLGSKKLTVNNVDVTDQVVETGGFGDTISCKYETTDVIRQASFKDNTDLVRVFGLDTSMMFHTEEMFSGCTNLVAILPVIDSSMAYSTRAMFKNCTSLTSINTIGNFSTASDKTEMFYNCSSLTGTVDANSYWDNAMISDHSNCFYNCTALDNYSDIPSDWGGPNN